MNKTIEQRAKEYANRPFASEGQKKLIEAAYIAGATEAQDDWKRVEDGLPDYEEDVLVYGLPVQRSPQMGGNIPIWTKAKRVDLSGTSIPKRDWLRYQDKNQFRMMEEVYSWKRVDLPSPPSNDNP